ncbi:helix-turn-helix protein [Pontibacter mucosus]|uniref:Helix-turn-helix protein n=1 Tax=Pontibacter mucosus TaxID=1649266 RepID=A0A2T5YCZ0_9BACT|nr:helix-turn-helix domain-containing protein [Pontibacter mucosus]PTX14398.1 helix-turn-helix protein [Pontibacter mucosus]
MTVAVVPAEQHEALLRRVEKLERLFEGYISAVDDEIKGYKAAGEYVGLSERQLRRLVKAGKVPCSAHGTRVTFSRKDLYDYKQSRKLAY